MNVNGMNVRVVESHEESLGDWADAFVAHGAPLTLITLDRHLDTAPALTAEFAEEAEEEDEDVDEEQTEKHRRRVLSRYRPADADGIEELVERLGPYLDGP